MTYRIVCNHLYHEQCWDDFLHRNGDECPNCRGPATAKALFRHMGVPERGVARPTSGDRGNATPEHSSFSDAQSEAESQRRAQWHAMNFPDHSQPATPPTPVQSTTFMTAEQLSEWSSSWSMLSPQEYTVSYTHLTLPTILLV